MLQVVVGHVKDIDNTLAKYPDKLGVNNLAVEHLDCLKEVMTCLESNDTNKALTLLEKSWHIRGHTQGLCIYYDCVSISKSFAKGVCSGAKRAINLPQRAVELYHTGKALGTLFGRIAEIDNLMFQGRVEEAEIKYEALKQDCVAVWEGLKHKIGNASADEVAFFMGELFGDIVATKGLHKGVQHLVKVVKPKVVKGMDEVGKKLERIAEKVEECVERIKKPKNNPGRSKQALTVEGVLFEVEEQVENVAKKSEKLLSRRKGKRVGSSKNRSGSKGKGSGKNKGTTASQKERIVNEVSKAEAYAYLKKNGYENYKEGFLRRKPGCKGLGKDAELVRWDGLHNEIEAYRNRTQHTGAIDPKTWKFYKPADPNRVAFSK